MTVATPCIAQPCPGCVSQGDDRQEALANIKEAIELVLDISGDVESIVETPAMIAGEIREVLDGRQQDGLPYAGISLEAGRNSGQALT